MIDRELLGKIKDKMDKDEEADSKKKEQRKKGKGCMSFLASAALMFFLILVLAALMPDENFKEPDRSTAAKPSPGRATSKFVGPSTAVLESEYAIYFEKPCLQSARYNNGNGKMRAGWKEGIKEGIINQASKYNLLSSRKKLYAAKVNNCEKIIASGQRQRPSSEYIPDYRAEIEFYLIDRCYKKLVREARPDLPSPDFGQIEKIKSVMRRDVEKTIKQLLPEVRGKPRKERLTAYESAMGKCRLPY